MNSRGLNKIVSKIAQLLSRSYRVFVTNIYLLKANFLSDGRIICLGRVVFDKQVRIEARKDSEIVFGNRINAKRNSEFRVFNGGRLIIADGCTFNNNCFIATGQEVIIGEGTIFAPNVVLVDHDHDYRSPGGIKNLAYKTGKVVIGKNVWIGANVVILRNTFIGDNAVIGAGCIVSGNIDANTVLTQEKVDKIKKYECRDREEM